MRMIEKSLLLQTLDQVWKEHLLNLDHLRQGIGLRAYGQLDPLREYKTEAFALFGTLLEDLKERVTANLSRVDFGQPAEPPPPPRTQMFENNPEELLTQSFGTGAGYAAGAVLEAPMVADQAAVGSLADLPEDWRNTPRNAPCPCGSGKKFKYCHGRLA
jgi:preprotein translocase subunit SecA